MAPADSPEVLARFHAELELVGVVARTLYRRLGALVEFDDLMSAGREGLLEASRRFDPACGTPFRVYARFRVEGAMHDGARRNSKLSRRALTRVKAEKAALSVRESIVTARPKTAAPSSEAPSEDSVVSELAALATAAAIAVEHAEVTGDHALQDSDNPEQAFARMELLAVVKDAVDELGPHETALIRRHYFNGEQLDEIAADLGMSAPSASRLHAKAISRLSKLLRSER